MLKELINFLTDRITANNPDVVQANPEAPMSVIVPDGYELTQLPGYIYPKPDHIKASRRFDTPASLIAYLDRFKSASELLISDVSARTVAATLDYHGPTPERCDHRAQWTMVLDETFRPWFDANEKTMTHGDFVAFLDTHGECIVSPTNAELVALVEQFEVITGNSVVSLQAQRGDRASLKITTKEEVRANDDKGQIVQPIRDFTIQTPVQQDGKSRDIKISVNYSTKGGQLGIRPVIHELAKLLSAEFKLGEAQITATGRKILAGSQ